jgi:hypothetical protein
MERSILARRSFVSKPGWLHNLPAGEEPLHDVEHGGEGCCCEPTCRVGQAARVATHLSLRNRANYEDGDAE